jgi:hypothetical protein
MQSMPGLQGVASGRELSAGAVLVFCGGLALYQMTSLVLGPVNSRQLNLSLTIPAVDVQDLSEPLASNIRVVVGTPATPAAPATGPTRISTLSGGSSTPTPRTSSHPLPLPIPSPRAGEPLSAGSRDFPRGQGQGGGFPPASQLHDDD